MCTQGQPADNLGQLNTIDWTDPLMVWRERGERERDRQTERDKRKER